MGGAVARAVALACLAVGLYAGPRGFRPSDDIAQAPLLAVARVESIAANPVPPEQVTSPALKRTCTANLRIVRFFGERVDTRVRLNYPCYPVDAPGGRSEVLPEIGTGGIYLVPFAGGRLFREDEQPYLVIATAPEGPPPASAREFIIRELANVLLRGNYLEVFRLGVMQLQLVDELMPRLTLKPGDPRWLDIATSQLTRTGIPRQPLPESGGPLAARALRNEARAARRERSAQHASLHLGGAQRAARGARRGAPRGTARLA